MADGYVIVEVNTEGGMRVKAPEGVLELFFFDIRMNCSMDWDNNFIISCLEEKLPDDLEDTLIMCTFDYQAIGGGLSYWEQEDYEDDIQLVDWVPLKKEYKEFYREMVTEELSSPPQPDQDLTYLMELVADWEEFYGEDFVPYERKHKSVMSFDAFAAALKLDNEEEK